MIRWLIAVSLLVANVAAAQPVRVVSTLPIAQAELPAVPVATHELRLAAHVFTGSRWSVTEIVAGVGGAARLLAQCDVALTNVELRVIEAPARFHVYFTPVSRALLRLIETTRPALFFVEDTRNQPAFDAEAIGRANSAKRPELADTVWISHGAPDLAITIAHELVHLLSDSGAHEVAPGNLMLPETAPDHTRLATHQCSALRTRGEANGLLTHRVGTTSVR